MSSSRLRSHLLVLVAVCLSLFAPQAAEAQRRPAVVHKPPVTDFVVQGDRFLVKRAGDTEFRREFLVFISYFDALTAADNDTLDADLTYIADHGFTGVRVFGTWHDMSGTPGDGCIVPFGPKNLFDENGNVRPDRRARLIEVIDSAHAKGLIVDLSFDHGTVGVTGHLSVADYKKALVSLTGTLSGRRNVLFDLQNEFDLGEDHTFPTHLSYAEVEELRDAVKAVDSRRIVTASTTYPTEEEDSPYDNGTAEMAWDTRLDVVAHHDARGDDWAAATTAVVGGLRWTPSGASSPKPVYLQEPRPFKHTAPLCGKSNQWDNTATPADNQRNALINAKAAGAAAWLFHIEHGFVLKSSSFAGNISLEPGLQDLIEGTAAHEKLALVAGGTNPPNPPTEITLVVGLDGDGSGEITSGNIINCTGTGPDCLETYTSSGATVTLAAAAAPGSTFEGWTVNGAQTCGVAPTCQVTVNGYTQVRAWFTAVREDTVEYLHQDALGSVRHVTNAAGTRVGIYDFRPFGEEHLTPDAPALNAHPTPRKYAGKERDAGTGLDYFGARYHMAVFGRFTTVDPALDVDGALVNPQLWNRYAYALNNPFKFSDPDGKNPLLIGGTIGAAVYGGWKAYTNVQQGRPWHEDIGVEAAKGFVIGVTLGAAAPVVAGSMVAADAALTAGTAAAPAAAQGIRVIGSYPQYKELAGKLGGKTFEIPMRVWEKMSISEQAVANSKFLERGIQAGDKYVVTRRVLDVLKERNWTWTKYEDEYLLKRGYKIGEDGMSLVP